MNTARALALRQFKNQMREATGAFLTTLISATVYLFCAAAPLIILASTLRGPTLLWLTPVLLLGGITLGIWANFALKPYLIPFECSVKSPTQSKITTLSSVFKNRGLSTPRIFVLTNEKNKKVLFICGLLKTRALVISESLLKKLSDEELKAALLHEVAHIELGHLRKKITTTIRVLLTHLGGAALFGTALLLHPVAHQNPLIQGLIVATLCALTSHSIFKKINRFQKNQEIEADLYSIKHLGSGAEALASVIRITTPKHNQNIFRLNSHPDSSERIQNLNGLAA